ncbi:hypothetical protein CHUAL_008341 [Chamberlinius hualienensis]
MNLSQLMFYPPRLFATSTSSSMVFPAIDNLNVNSTAIASLMYPKTKDKANSPDSSLVKMATSTASIADETDSDVSIDDDVDDVITSGSDSGGDGKVKIYHRPSQPLFVPRRESSPKQGAIYPSELKRPMNINGLTKQLSVNCSNSELTSALLNDMPFDLSITKTPHMSPASANASKIQEKSSDNEDNGNEQPLDLRVDQKKLVKLDVSVRQNRIQPLNAVQQQSSDAIYNNNKHMKYYQNSSNTMTFPPVVDQRSLLPAFPPSRYPFLTPIMAINGTSHAHVNSHVNVNAFDILRTQMEKLQSSQQHHGHHNFAVGDRHLKKHESDGPTILDDGHSSPKSPNELNDKDETYFDEIRNFIGKVTSERDAGSGVGPNAEFLLLPPPTNNRHSPIGHHHHQHHHHAALLPVHLANNVQQQRNFALKRKAEDENNDKNDVEDTKRGKCVDERSVDEHDQEVDDIDNSSKISDDEEAVAADDNDEVVPEVTNDVSRRNRRKTRRSTRIQNQQEHSKRSSSDEPEGRDDVDEDEHEVDDDMASSPITHRNS